MGKCGIETFMKPHSQKAGQPEKREEVERRENKGMRQVSGLRGEQRRVHTDTPAISRRCTLREPAEVTAGAHSFLLIRGAVGGADSRQTSFACVPHTLRVPAADVLIINV